MTTALTTKGGFSLAPKNLDEAMRVAEVLASSTIVPKDYQKNPGNILVALQWGAEIGLQPLQAMQNISVINGRPAVWGDAMLAIVRGSGLLEYIKEEATDEVATCRIKRKGEDEAVRTFSMAEAKKAGLLNRGVWTTYPKRMMQMRARAFALRDVFPDVLRGVGIAEEVRDIPPAKDMGEVEVVQPKATATKTDALKAKLAKKAVEEAIAKMNACTTCEELKHVASGFNGQFEGEAKKQVADAYRAKKKELQDAEAVVVEAVPVEPDPETGEVAFTAPQVEAMIHSSKDIDQLSLAMDAIRSVPKEHQEALWQIAQKREGELQ